MTSIKWRLRQNPWNVHKNCFKTIENTKLILSEIIDKVACDNFKPDKSNKFFNSFEIGDNVIIYENNNNNNALLVKIISNPYRKNIDEIKIYKKEGYENDYGNNVVEVCHEKTKPTQEFDIIENMDAYVRDVIILGYVLINENFPNDFEGTIFENTCEESKNVSYLPYLNLKSTDNKEYQMYKGNFNIPPGFIQYKISKDNILNLNVEELKESNENFKTDFEIIENNLETLSILTPDTETGNANSWELIFAIKSHIGEDMCIKGALLNLSTNEIALMSSLNESSSIKYKQKNHLTLESKDGKWKICRSKMIANLFFWDELKKRVIKMEEQERKKEPLNVYKVNTQIVRNPVLQSKFRQDVKNRFNQCLVTGMYDDVCEACHIKPFNESSEEECFDINNGLFFNCLIHKLFDKFDISINPETLKIEISKKCKNYKFINQYDNMYLSKLEPFNEVKNYLKIHYSLFISQ